MRRIGLLALATIVDLSACQNDGLTPTRLEKPATLSQTIVTKDSGYVLLEGTPVHVVFEIRDGRAVFESDIDLGPADGIARTEDELLRRVQQGPTGVVATTNKRWPSGRVPYSFHHPFGTVLSDTQPVLAAMADVQSQSGGVSFVRRTSWDNDYVLFQPTTDEDICGRSDVGKTGGMQIVWINNPNCNKGGIMHELGHALGFWHEQSRCDRDSFVQILSDNIKDGRSDQFTKLCINTIQLESYDESSIMHYDRFAFGKTGPDGFPLQTIRSLRGLDELMGQRLALSNIDAFTLVRMYQPYGPYIHSIVNQDGHPFLSWSASGRPTSYSIIMMRTYDEWDDYNGTHTAYDEWLGHPGGNTTDQSWLDMPSSFTGNYLCQLWSNINGSAGYTYYYEITAYYGNGVTSSSQRQLAPVAPASPPCPDYYE